MVYTLIGKLLNYACVPDPEHDKFTSTEAYTWEQVAESDELGQFLTEAGINSTKQRSKLERLLHRDGFDTLGDLHEAATTLEDTARTARRVFGSAHPLANGIEECLQSARVALHARETPPASA